MQTHTSLKEWSSSSPLFVPCGQGGMEDYFFGVWRNGGSTETNDRPTHRPRSRSSGGGGGGGGGDGHDGSCGVRVSLGSERKNERTNGSRALAPSIHPADNRGREGGMEGWMGDPFFTMSPLSYIRPSTSRTLGFVQQQSLHIQRRRTTRMGLVRLLHATRSDGLQSAKRRCRCRCHCRCHCHQS